MVSFDFWIFIRRMNNIIFVDSPELPADWISQLGKYAFRIYHWMSNSGCVVIIESADSDRSFPLESIAWSMTLFTGKLFFMLLRELYFVQIDLEIATTELKTRQIDH